MQLENGVSETSTVTIGEGQEQFTLTLRPPTDDERHRELSIALEALSLRLGYVTGWSSVESEGQAVPFTTETLIAAVRLNPPFAAKVADALQQHAIGSLRAREVV